MALDLLYLPQIGAFLFVFAITLGLLTTTKLFNKNVNAALAAVFGLFSAIYEPFVTSLQVYLPIAAAILAILFFFVFIDRLFNKKKEGAGGSQSFDALPIGVAFVSLLLVLISQWQYIEPFLPAGIDATNVAWIVGLIAVLGIFAAVYRHH